MTNLLLPFRSFSTLGNLGALPLAGADVSGSKTAADAMTQRELASILTARDVRSANLAALLSVGKWNLSATWKPSPDVLASVGNVLANAAADRRRKGGKNPLEIGVDGNFVAGGSARNKPSQQVVAGVSDVGGSIATVTDAATTSGEENVRTFRWRDEEVHLDATHLPFYLLDLVCSLPADVPTSCRLEIVTTVAGNKSHSIPKRVMALRLMENEFAAQEATFQTYLEAAELLISILKEKGSDLGLQEKALHVIRSEWGNDNVFTEGKILFENNVNPVANFKLDDSGDHHFTYTDLKRFEPRFQAVAAALPKLLWDGSLIPSHLPLTARNEPANIQWSNIIGGYLELPAEGTTVSNFLMALQLAAKHELPIFDRGLALVYAFDLLNDNAVLQETPLQSEIFVSYFNMLRQLNTGANDLRLQNDAALLFCPIVLGRFDIAKADELEEMLQQAEANREILMSIVTKSKVTESIDAAFEILRNEVRRRRRVVAAAAKAVEDTKKRALSLFLHELRFWERFFLRDIFFEIYNSDNANALQLLKEIFKWSVRGDESTILGRYHIMSAALHSIAAALKIDPSFPASAMLVAPDMFPPPARYFGRWDSGDTWIDPRFVGRTSFQVPTGTLVQE